MSISNAPAVQDHRALRFLTAGSVDDGKSTLIGRLLYDSRAILADQLDTLEKKAAGAPIDLSLLTDGLEAEREQGITIDIAYRYFATPVRKFIIADAPGHEQYTRNMVTGASTADAAIILIDATRVGDDGLLQQTRRHSAIAKLLGIRHIVVAVNKIDLLDYDAATFERIRALYGDLATRLGLQNIHYVPVSALAGDNVVHVSARTPWYRGPSLLALLEDLDAGRNDTHLPLRFPVQSVIRANGSSTDDFRGYAGQVWTGALRRGQRIRIVPGNETATVAEIHTFDGALEVAGAGRSVTVRLDRDVDVSRGAMLIDPDDQPRLESRFDADLCWLDRTPLDARRKYWLRHGTKTVHARVSAINDRLDLQTLSAHSTADTLAMNDIGSVTITAQQPILCDAYSQSPATGAFVLIDAVTNQTAAAGMIRA